MTKSSLRTEAILCNQCGASLQIAPGTNFANCSFCGCQLKIHRSGGAVFSEVIEEIKQAQKQTDNRVKILELENQLLKLDQAWEHQKERYMIYPKDGRPYLPGESSSIPGAVAAVIIIPIFLFVFVSAANHIGGGAILFALPVAGIIAFSFITGNSKKKLYEAAKTDHLNRRAQITHAIAQLRKK